MLTIKTSHNGLYAVVVKFHKLLLGANHKQESLSYSELPRVNQGKGTFRGVYASSLVTPDHFALTARCKRLQRALAENLK